MMELSSELLKIIVCPVTGGKLLYDRDNKELISLKAALAFPIKENIPLLLVDHARRILPSQYQHLAEEESRNVIKNSKTPDVSEVA